MNTVRALRIGALAGALSLGACVTAPSPSMPLPAVSGGQVLYVVNPSHTFPHFAVSHLDLSTHRGRFNKTSGWIVLDRGARTGSMELVIDANSIDTGDPTLEQRLREADFFDAETYPTITFRSSKVRFQGEVPSAVDGELTIRNVTKPVTLNVTGFRCAPLPLIRVEACGAAAETSLKRADFGISIFPSMIGADIQLVIQIEAHRR